ncbi:MAG: hypothetical protein JSV04_01890 [Candidatus Heimdallarchaeota archaeon]|nr:MAG: hypothetical protein JSV04_01890 [Candidatus Heimdallarchaeota archaeon]
MKRTISSQKTRKIEITELTQKYYALQEKGSGDCPDFHTIEKFDSKKEAQHRMDHIAKMSLENNRGFSGYRIIYVEEVELAQENRE